MAKVSSKQTSRRLVGQKKYQSPKECYLGTETRELESHTDTRVIDLAKVSSKNTPRRLVSQKRNRAQEIVS